MAASARLVRSTCPPPSPNEPSIVIIDFQACHCEPPRGEAISLIQRMRLLRRFAPRNDKWNVVYWARAIAVSNSTTTANAMLICAARAWRRVNASISSGLALPAESNMAVR